MGTMDTLEIKNSRSPKPEFDQNGTGEIIDCGTSKYIDHRNPSSTKTELEKLLSAEPVSISPQKLECD
jgi:hypothetical protein